MSFSFVMVVKVPRTQQPKRKTKQWYALHTGCCARGRAYVVFFPAQKTPPQSKNAFEGTNVFSQAKNVSSGKNASPRKKERRAEPTHINHHQTSLANSTRTQRMRGRYCGTAARIPALLTVINRAATISTRPKTNHGFISTVWGGREGREVLTHSCCWSPS